MSKPIIKSDTDNKDAPPTTLKMNPETSNLIRKARGPKKTLNERIAEFEEKLKKDEQAEEAKKNPAIAMLPIQVNTEEERMGATSARSDQKLIMSDQDESDARRDENAEGKRRRGPRRGPKARIQEPEIMETNVDTGGQVNPAFEDTETIRTANEENEAGNKPLKKRVRRAKKMTDKIDQTRDPFILAVIVHKTDKLRTDTNIYHPVVRIHILDLDADGQYVKKTKRERNVLFYYEKENRNLDHISPIMTSPFDFKENRTIIPRWEERVVFNEEFSHFVQEHPNVLIMFELLDSFKHSTDESGAEVEYKDPSHTSQDTGRNWNRIAWAFLKLVGSNNSLNIGKKIRLQLYYNQSQYRQNLLDSLVPEVYSLYKQGPRIKYPSSLHVTIRPIHPAKQFYLGIGSSYMIDEEMGMVDEGRSTAANSAAELRKASGVDGAEEDPDRPIDDPNAAVAKKKTVIWSRLPGKACNVPNELALSFPSTKYGCYSVKFSTSGSYLACACVDEDNGYPILIFDIPEGNFHASFSGHFGVVYEIAWSNLDRYMLTASHDATVRVFDFEKKSRDAYKIFPHPSFIYSAKFHPYSFDTVCTAGYDKVIRVWSLGNKKKTRQQKYGELLQELSGHMGFVNSICFSNDGNFLYSADSVGVIKLWNCFPIGEMEFKQWSFREDIEIDELKNQCINYIQTHPNRFSILIQTRDNQLKLIDTRVKMVVQRYKGTFSFTQNLKSAISPCGTFLFNSGSDTKIYCWNIITGDLVANPIVLNYMKPARDIDFHPYDNYIAFCSYETRAPIYVYKYNPKKAMHDVVQAAPNVAFESDIEIEKKPSESKVPKPVLIDKEDPLSARKAEASSKSQFKYTGPKDYQEIVVGLYDYTAQRNDELDFVKGDEIVVLVRENENWCLGEMVKTRQQGYFPANYVQDKSHFVQSRARYQSQAPIRDALLEYQRVYDENAFDSMGIKKDPLTGQTSDKSPRKPKTTDSVNVINEVPTKDGSDQINRRKDQTKRRAFAHIISGSDHTVTEI